MSKRITKEYLERLGISVEYPFVYKNTVGRREVRKLCKQITYAGADEIKYLFYSVWHDGHLEHITEARIVYAWYKGEVPENTDVIHLDGDILNNSPDNLALSPRKGRKRK